MSLKLGTIDISGVPTALINTVNNKLDASTYTSNPRTNAVYITQTYHNGASWYRVWSDGFIEQGGIKTGTSSSNSTQFSLNKTMTTTNYIAIVHANYPAAVTSTSNATAQICNRYNGTVVAKYTSYFNVQTGDSSNNQGSYAWYVAGY